jgi:leucyl aminopeptidase
MKHILKEIKNIKNTQSALYIVAYKEELKAKDLASLPLTEKQKNYVLEMAGMECYLLNIPEDNKNILIHLIKSEENKDAYQKIQEYRIAGIEGQKLCNKLKIKTIQIISSEDKNAILGYTEAMILSNYQFLTYKSEKKPNSLAKISMHHEKISQKELDDLNTVIEATFIARDLVNEPGSHLSAEELSKRIEEYGQKAGFYTEILNLKKIKSLKMGGLLAVNRGSFDPPTFNILEWKPEKYKNSKPIVLVGKGVVFDTGGLNLKPGNYMDEMKSDMSGAAAVTGVFHALAQMKLPLHVVGLIPATDNRPGNRAYFPGDIITMYDGTQVEVLNTDAEGRLILADALAYAKKYKPELVIDIATLTGAAAMAIGKYGIPYMTIADHANNALIETAGKNTYERLIHFPLWDEYEELLKSNIGDLKNIGGREAGTITAGKFLQKFTDYPWMHLDIAGSAFMKTAYTYMPKGGTGIGVRLIIEFLKLRSKQ